MVKCSIEVFLKYKGGFEGCFFFEGREIVENWQAKQEEGKKLHTINSDSLSCACFFFMIN